MAVMELEIYFTVQTKLYLHTKFRWDISIHNWDITTSVSENRWQSH